MGHRIVRKIAAAAAMATGTAALATAMALGSAGMAQADQNVVKNTGNKVTPGSVTAGVTNNNGSGGLFGFLKNLGTVGTNAISQVGTAGNNAISQVGTAGNNALSQVGTAGNNALSQTGTAVNNAVSQVTGGGTP